MIHYFGQVNIIISMDEIVFSIAEIHFSVTFTTGITLKIQEKKEGFYQFSPLYTGIQFALLTTWTFFVNFGGS